MPCCHEHSRVEHTLLGKLTLILLSTASMRVWLFACVRPGTIFHFVTCRHSGRPRIDVQIEDIEYLRELRFSWTRIAKLLDISRSTLYRRLEEEGISRHLTFTSISDIQLDTVAREVKNSHPNDGERLMIGHLARRNIIVPRARLRGSIHRVDPINTA